MCSLDLVKQLWGYEVLFMVIGSRIGMCEGSVNCLLQLRSLSKEKTGFYTLENGFHYTSIALHGAGFWYQIIFGLLVVTSKRPL
jgi:hypothetical protein